MPTVWQPLRRTWSEYRDERLEAGKSASTVRLELSLLSHLFTIAIKEWRVGLFYNPVANIRKPAPAKGRNRRLTADEEKALFKACDKHSNSMLGSIARIALYTGGEKTVLQGGNLIIPKGALTTLTGPSGAGKTTIIDLVTGLFRPQSGKVLVDDVDLALINLRQWRKKIGYVPQENLLLHDGILNIC